MTSGLFLETQASRHCCGLRGRSAALVQTVLYLIEQAHPICFLFNNFVNDQINAKVMTFLLASTLVGSG